MSDYKVIAPPTMEPVTLAEVKAHLRLDSSTFAGDVSAIQSIAPGNHTDGMYTGVAVDALGKIALVNFNAGTCGGSVAAKIQESDDNIFWQDFGAFVTVTDANDNSVQAKDYTGGKQYVRVVATVTGTCEFSADVIVKSGNTIEDNELLDMIAAAREFCEDYTGRGLATQTVELYMDCFPRKDEYELPRPPLQSVTSVRYKNSAGAETVMAAGAQYLVDTDRGVGRIKLPYGASWPSFVPYPVNPVATRFVTGYSADNPMPKSIKQAMLLHIGFYYRNRDAVDLDDETHKCIKRLLSRYRVWWF